jgi:spermidine synthase
VNPWLLAPVFAATLFLSAWLLLAIQPIVSKSLLPWLGGSSSVWNTCVVFFQVGLLAGYGYVHLAVRRLGVRRHAILHGLLLAGSLLLLPVSLAPASPPPSEGSPIPWLLEFLIRRIGVPFFLIASSAPLLQRWFGTSRHARAGDPYVLYAVSNAGSLLGLLTYPTLVEPSLTLGQQQRLWSMGYGWLAALIAACGAISLLAGAQHPSASVLPGRAPLTWQQRLRWILLAAIPSSLLLGVTTHLTTDIASVPLLWVIPLSLYLLTFILAFGSAQRALPSWLSMAQPIVIVPLAVAMVGSALRPAWLIIGLHLAALFLTALLAHRLLAADRPPVSQLTEFYLWISLGGALGGLFNALLAPAIFPAVVEYPLALVLGSLIRARCGPKPSPADLAVPAALAGLVAAARWLTASGAVPANWLGVAVLGLLASAALALWFRPVAFSLILALLFLGEDLGRPWQRVLHRRRSFYGAYRVLAYDEQAPHHLFIHGSTIHGAERLDAPSCAAQRLLYFNPNSPISEVAGLVNRRAPAGHVGVVGLGIGTLGAYALSAQRWTFYELDPLVRDLATDPRWFSVLRRCAPQAEVVLGDARLTLAAEDRPPHDLLILDAFSSDAIPVHLLTREAMAVYLRRLAPGGLLAFQITNRYVELEPVLAALAEASGLVALARKDVVPASQRSLTRWPSHWVVMAREATMLEALEGRPGWRRLAADPRRPAWRDDRSNLLRAIRWR